MIISACAPKRGTVTLTVYFTNRDRYAVGTEPYEDPVMRTVPLSGSLAETTLAQVFLGPTPEEKAQGLETILSGTTGFSKLTVQDGIARVYLIGKCNSGGATYTIGNLIFANLAHSPGSAGSRSTTRTAGRKTRTGRRILSQFAWSRNNELREPAFHPGMDSLRAQDSFHEKNEWETNRG